MVPEVLDLLDAQQRAFRVWVPAVRAVDVVLEVVRCVLRDLGEALA